ncbi:hypothetical protein GPECTOR_9g436 [Gonium pectorale]|uniref:Uncharacterized protein n=1 Tax=Gonium pectorale TaxID=33097 RepID=A0A150GRK8_GONPE|nr:hypothetical protein GPECTOR_9g436 [Gonium pectorale]|eukprot:KXZ52392.1 hypothetical protein GPECTOR_9g436 [Gonium pectorale]
MALTLAPHGTKTQRYRRGPAFTITAHREAPLCFVRNLSLYLELCEAGGPGLVVTKYVLRPLEPNHRRFKDAPLTSNALGQHLKDHLAAAGLYEGEACHSFRHGGLQDAEANGASQSELKAKGQIRARPFLCLSPERAHISSP